MKRLNANGWTKAGNHPASGPNNAPVPSLSPGGSSSGATVRSVR